MRFCINIFLLLLGSCLTTVSTTAQWKAAPLVEAGMLAGGQATSTKFYFKNAYTAAIGIAFSSDVSIIQLAASAGVDEFNEETLFPFQITLSAFKSPEKVGGYFLVSGGYSFAHHDDMQDVVGLDYRGGANVSAGYGYSRKVGKKMWLLSSIRVRQQFMNTNWEIAGRPKTENRFNYMLLQFVVGIQI